VVKSLHAEQCPVRPQPYRRLLPQKEKHMPWLAWVLIAIGVIGIGYLKLKVLGKIMQKRKEALAAAEED
jgi:hypothetical protein